MADLFFLNLVLAIFGLNFAILAQKWSFWPISPKPLMRFCDFFYIEPVFTWPISPKRFDTLAQFSLWKLQLCSITIIT